MEVAKSPVKPKSDNAAKGENKIENVTSSSVVNGKSHAVDSESWPQKHRPQSINDIIGNQSIVNHLFMPC